MEREPARKKKLARTGEVTARGFQMSRRRVLLSRVQSSERCSIVLTFQHELLFVCVARVVSPRSWNRKAKKKKRLISLNLPVEA